MKKILIILTFVAWVFGMAWLAQAGVGDTRADQITQFKEKGLDYKEATDHGRQVLLGKAPGGKVVVVMDAHNEKVSLVILKGDVPPSRDSIQDTQDSYGQDWNYEGMIDDEALLWITQDGQIAMLYVVGENMVMIVDKDGMQYMKGLGKVSKYQSL